MLLGGDILRDDEHLAHGWRDLDTFWQEPSLITCSITLARVLRPARADQGFFKQRAGVGELQVLAVVVDMADVGQGEDRLAAVAFAAGHGGNGAGGGDGGLGGVADAVQADTGGHPVPVQRRAAQSC